jgi:hypothetical protein
LGAVVPSSVTGTPERCNPTFGFFRGAPRISNVDVSDGSRCPRLSSSTISGQGALRARRFHRVIETPFFLLFSRKWAPTDRLVLLATAATVDLQVKRSFISGALYR